MPLNSHQHLASFYSSSDIYFLWQNSQQIKIINHPTKGLISPNEYRTFYTGKPCPYCAQKMTQGAAAQTKSHQKAIQRGYYYKNHQGIKNDQQGWKNLLSSTLCHGRSQAK